MTDRTLCGWRVRSDIPLTETLPWAGPEDHPVDVMIRLGEVPCHLDAPVRVEPMCEIGADGAFLFSMRNAGRYLTRNGNEIIVDPLCPPDWPDQRLFIQNICLSTLALQRGVLAMHGAVVRVSGKTIAILGTSGQGKSTLTATLAQRGHKFMSEDICALDLEGDAGAAPTVIPTLPNIRLWEDALERLSIDPAGLVRSRRRLRKYHVTRPQWFHDHPEPLDAFITLGNAKPPTFPEGVYPARGSGAIYRLCRFIQCPFLAKLSGFEHGMVRMAMRYVSAGRVFDLRAARHLDHLASVADDVEKLAVGLDG